jgi:pimeloyl-ACP methyl ester carboxylesterase
MSCGKCNVSFGAFTWGTKCPTEQGGCGKQFCSKCIDFALTTKDLAIVNQFCEACFIKNSRLDFSKTEKVLGVEEGQGVSILFVHGAGGCRTMFEVHAKQLAEKGFRCVLMDLPGHGSRMNEKLTLQTALETIAKTVKDHCADYKGIKPIYVGGSLGGYIGMEAIGTYPNLFSGAIICMAGQDVRLGCFCWSIRHAKCHAHAWCRHRIKWNDFASKQERPYF